MIGPPADEEVQAGDDEIVAAAKQYVTEHEARIGDRIVSEHRRLFEAFG